MKIGPGRCKVKYIVPSLFRLFTYRKISPERVLCSRIASWHSAAAGRRPRRDNPRSDRIDLPNVVPGNLATNHNPRNAPLKAHRLAASACLSRRQTMAPDRQNMQQQHCRRRTDSAPIAIAKSEARGRMSERSLRNQLRGGERGSSNEQE
jgi:hypothetical protein